MPELIDIVDRLPKNLTSRWLKLRPLHAIRYIVVHYDGVDVPAPCKDGCLGYDPIGRYVAQARHHMNRNWNADGEPKIAGFGLMYHYRVSADGRVWRTQPEEVVTWHTRSANYSGLAVCCDLGQGQLPTQAQVTGLKWLLDRLCRERPDIPASHKDVWGHAELHRRGNRTLCPGHLLEWVQAYRKGLIA